MNEPVRFLDRPANLRRLRRVFYALCAALVGLEVVVHRHAGHAWEETFAFHALYGFIACVALVLAAKQMRRVLMRREDYYERRPHDVAPPPAPRADQR